MPGASLDDIEWPGVSGSVLGEMGGDMAMPSANKGRLDRGRCIDGLGPSRFFHPLSRRRRNGTRGVLGVLDKGVPII